MSKAGQGDGNVVGHEREKIGPCGWLMSDIQAIAFIAIVLGMVVLTIWAG